jgi:4-alpha-glucanotransferase
MTVPAAGTVASTYIDQVGRTVVVEPRIVRAVQAVAGQAVAMRTEPPIRPLAPQPQRRFGWAIQLYQLRSAQSWGIGDYADLAALAVGLAQRGAALLVVNPLHAQTPVAPYGDSPYYPSSRRFCDQLSVSVTRLPEFHAAALPVRQAVSALRPPTDGLIDRAAIWAAKLAAFDLLLPVDFDAQAAASTQPDGPELLRFAAFCALAQAHGGRFRDWPQDLRVPGPSADAAVDPRQVALHVWIQVRAREQLATAQAAARAAGMAVGIVHDLAVGVSPDGADAWLLGDYFAAGITIGAPPDEFNQLGQDWGLPAARPDRLAEQSFAPWREIVEVALRLGGGLRIDHVLGLSRLWWVPSGLSAAEGTFVSYDTESMLRVVVDAAREHGGVIIGEDLGTVDPAFRRRLAELGILGSAVLWFEGADEGQSRMPADWRAAAAASVSTHDLPTAYGFLRGEHVTARYEAGVLVRPLGQEQASAATDRAELLDLLRGQGLLEDEDLERPDRIVAAMYEALCLSPSAIVLAAPADAVGDLRQPNLPGTVDQYPNWAMPLADGAGHEVTLEEFLASPGTARLSVLLRDGLGANP